MNLPISGKLIVPKTLKPEDTADRIATIMISFNYNAIIDYKVYERLKQIASFPELQTEQLTLKIKNNGLNLIFKFTAIDSDYLFTDRLINLNGNGHYCIRSEKRENFLFILEE